MNTKSSSRGPSLSTLCVLFLGACTFDALPENGEGGAGLGNGGSSSTASGGVGSTNTGTGASSGTGANSATGAQTGAGGGDASGGTSAQADCAAIAEAGHELCSGDTTTCTAVFNDGSGCHAVCALAGLACAAALENIDGQCAADTTRPAVSCDSGHVSDYCECEGPAAGTGGAGSGGAASSGGAGSGGGDGSGGNGSGGGTEAGVVGQPIGFASLNGGTTGGLGGPIVQVNDFAGLKQYAESSEPYVILVEGTISNGSSGARLSVKSNKSIVGLGNNAFLSGIGVAISSSNNVILQNLKITLVGTSNPSAVNGGDAIVINGTSKNVWIDHCEIYSENPSVQTDIDKYDGLIDIRDQTGFVTVSWNYIHDHHKACLVGASDTDLHADRKVTYHHNHFARIVKRMPMYRGAVGHFFNNYVLGTPATEASFVMMNTCLRVEKNVYENVKYSIYSQTGGTAGKAQRIDNIESQSRAYPSSCTADIPYDYGSVLTPVGDVKSVVPAGAGVGKL